ncbi:unnamed protein product [Adineta steineri]|uniref:Aprataxin and PNK-like factor n=1 Tax=Adineta steineri TaxID=433720 RepID=A0A814DRZ8_9BILA|nr:unnamed protein product [Adineta steineri]CAF0999797.1 unnamed protein product [Adineta steineri]CAF1331172.1 unnamed protein product [Adineta steineri]
MTSKVELVPISEGNRVTVKENDKIIIGRGSSLGCNDKKISRQHAELLLKKDQTLWIKPTHSNPVFYRPLNCKTIHLTKDIEQELKDGDQIGLLPTTFFFRISFSTDTNNNKDATSSKCIDNHISIDTSKRLTTDVDNVTTSSSIKDQEESQSENSNKLLRKLPAWMSPSTSSPRSDNTKRQLSLDEDTNELTTETFDSVTPKKSFDLVKSNNKPRPPCQYGASCYRKNQLHRTEESHPGDSDYEDEKEKETKDDDNKDTTSSDTDKPQCPYGKTCYRQNAQHKRDYKH